MNTSDIVIKTKVTLSRNVKGYPFPSKMDDKRASVIASSVFDAINDGNYDLYNLNQIGEGEINCLIEKGLITPTLARKNNASAIIKKNETTSVMINGEDHVEICVFDGVCDLDSTYDECDKLDDKIEAKLKYAYSEKLGYLTSSPTNAGTGLHVSVLLFLPGLILTENIKECRDVMSRINVALKPVKIKNVEYKYVYELSSVHTMGVSEKEIVEKIKSALSSVTAYEKKARDRLLKTNEVALKDKIMRSYGTVTNCYRLGIEEMLEALAFVRLGAYYNMLAVSDVSVIDKLCLSMQDNTLAKSRKARFESAIDRDVYRAQKVVETVKSL